MSEIILVLWRLVSSCASPPFCFVRRCIVAVHVDQRIDGQTSVDSGRTQRCDVPATLLPQDECEGCRRKSSPGDRSGSQAGVRCRGMSPWGFDDGCSAQVGYLLYGDLQTERRYVCLASTQKVCGADVPIRFIRFSLLCA